MSVEPNHWERRVARLSLALFCVLWLLFVVAAQL
jgi:hypothetical protein